VLIKLIQSEDRKALESWDDFLLNCPRGHYRQLSTWLRSFKAYGFDFSVLLGQESANQPIRAGIGILHFGNRLFRLMTALGPIVDAGFEEASSEILDAAINYAQNAGTSVLQLQFPCSDNVQLPALLPSISLSERHLFQEGIAFQMGSAPNQMLWVDFPTNQDAREWRETLLDRFDSHTRRNVRAAEKQTVEVSEATTESELKSAYSIVEKNAEDHGYSVRTWRDFGNTLIEQVEKHQAIVLVAHHEGKTLGTHYGVLAGKRYSYIMGGTTRTQPDRKIGHLLHWKAMNRARELGLTGYDFTSGGSPGVMRFKMGFAPKEIEFVQPRFIVFSPVRHVAFRFVYPWLKKHKRIVSGLLSSARRAFKLHS
jgi:hypothetical protein